MNLGAGGEAVLVADLEVEWLMSRAHVENESVHYLVGSSMAPDFDHIDVGLWSIRNLLTVTESPNLRVVQPRPGHV
jgi:hypothetical protein